MVRPLHDEAATYPDAEPVEPLNIRTQLFCRYFDGSVL